MVLFAGMPTSPYLYADDLNDVLKKKHASGTYKSMVSRLRFLMICFVVVGTALTGKPAGVLS